MKQFLLSVYFWLMLIIVTFLGLGLLPLFLLAYLIFGERKLDVAIRWGICIYGWTLVKLIPFLAPVKVESRTGKIPSPVVFVPNHNSAIDPYLFGALFTDACFITTWPFKIPVYRYFMRLAGYIDAAEGWEKVCQNSVNALQSGTSLIIWPEGHRSRDGRLGRFKNGAFAISVKTGYPLIPVCILGSRKFLPPGKRLITASLVKLILLEPIYPEMGNDPRLEIIKLRKAVREVIKKTLGENIEPLPAVSYPKTVARGEKC